MPGTVMGMGAAGRRVRMSLSVAAVFCGFLAPAAHAQNAAAVPDLNGMWGRGLFGYATPYVVVPEGTVEGGHRNPILKPWPVEIVNLKAQGLATRRLAIPHTTCWPEGVPGLLGLRVVEVLQTPKKITLVYEDDHYVRHVYLDQPHSKTPAPSWLGESVGHWQGDTLVVDTVGFVTRLEASVDRYGTPVTGGLHVVERYRLVDGAVQEPVIGGISQRNAALNTLDPNGKTLRVDVTVEDPNVFYKPWSTVVAYKPDRAVMREVVCPENNRAYGEMMPIAAKADF